MDRLYFPYVIGSDSPIPYLFQQTSIRLDSTRFQITIFSNRREEIIGTDNISEQYVDRSRWLQQRIKFVLTSLRKHDLIHTGGREAVHWPIWKITRCRNREVTHIHTLRVDVDPDSKYPTKLRQKIANTADVVTAVSKHTAKTAEREFDVSPEVIYNGVDTGLFHPRYRRPLLFDKFDIEDPVFLFVGAFEGRKRPGDVITVAENVPDATFVMVGDGPLYQEIRSRAEGLENVVLTGRVEKSQLPPIYANVTGLLFPTVCEGCPNVVLEAMASGTPVVGYRATSMPELVANGERGHLANKADVRGLVEGVQSMIDTTRDIEMGKSARDYAVKNHTFDQIAEQYERIYEQLLSE